MRRGARGSSARPACRWRPPRSGCAGRRRRRRRRRHRARRSRASSRRPGSSRPASASTPSSGFRNERSGFWPMARMQASAVERRGRRRRRSAGRSGRSRRRRRGPSAARRPRGAPSPRKRFGPRRGRKATPSLLRLLELLVPLRRPEDRHLVEVLERDDRHLGGAAAQGRARRVERLLERGRRPRPRRRRGRRRSSSRPKTRSAVRAASKATKPPPMTTTRRPRSMR